MPSAQFLIIALALAPLNSQQPASGPHAGSFTCPVTTPNGQQYGDPPEGGNHGNEFLVTGLWPDGKVIFKPGGPGFVARDGSLQMKFWWWRRVKGQLTFEGRRLDGPAPPLRAYVPQGYGESGFQATGLIFPMPGCWEVTGRVGAGSLTFVTQVVKVGKGPSPAAP